MLSERERQQLTEIERWLAADYPDFPRFMARRRRPLIDSTGAGLRWLGRQLRHRLFALVLVAMWLAGLGVSAAANGWVGVWTYLIIAAPFVVLAAPLAVVALVEHRRRRAGMLPPGESPGIRPPSGEMPPGPVPPDGAPA